MHYRAVFSRYFALWNSSSRNGVCKLSLSAERVLLPKLNNLYILVRLERGYRVGLIRLYADSDI